MLLKQQQSDSRQNVHQKFTLTSLSSLLFYLFHLLFRLKTLDRSIDFGTILAFCFWFLKRARKTKCQKREKKIEKNAKKLKKSKKEEKENKNLLSIPCQGTHQTRSDRTGLEAARVKRNSDDESEQANGFRFGVTQAGITKHTHTN